MCEAAAGRPGSQPPGVWGCRPQPGTLGAEKLKNSPAGVVVNYQGITVDADTKMRKALREALSLGGQATAGGALH